MATPKKTAAAPDFLAAAKDLFEDVPVIGLPEGLADWNVVARPLTGREMRRVTQASLKGGKSIDDEKAEIDEDAYHLAVIAASILDADTGERLIPEGREADLLALPSRVYVPLQMAAMRANGMLDAAEAPGKA